MGKDVESGVRALAQNFGRLVANHRRRLGWSQEKLAEKADISPGMIAKIETGVTGVRFPMIVRIAQALDVDPAELFYSQLPRGKLNQGRRREIITAIEELSEDDLAWVHDLLKVSFRATGRGIFAPSAAAPKRKIVRAPKVGTRINLAKRRKLGS
jgi:transcriptional regulator with XRE-family HTH domain